MNNPKGIAYAALSSSTFGLAPLFTVTLLRDGFSPFEVLTYRWGVASAALLLFGLATGRRLRIARRDFGVVFLLSLFRAGCSLSLVFAYANIATGVASTIHFLYPLAVALAMTLFFRERCSRRLFSAIAVSLAGAALLSSGDIRSNGGDATFGIAAAFFSVISYAGYIIGVRKSRAAQVESTTLTLLVMAIGAVCSILPLIAGYIFALFIGKKVKAKDEPTNAEAIGQTYEELVASYGKLPGAFMSFAPIVVPIILMGVASAFSMAGSNPAIIVFLGKPIIALAVGLILGVILMAQSGKMGEFYALTDDTLKTVGPILFVTAAGGVLGKVISSSDLVNFITTHANTLETLGLLFPFLLAAILKTAQGSSTVAITTSAGILAPLMMTLGFVTPLDAALVVVAIGAGAMTVSHANDSYFWVVTNFGEMEPQDGYKTQTLGTLVIGVAAIINVLLISAIF